MATRSQQIFQGTFYTLDYCFSTDFAAFEDWP